VVPHPPGFRGSGLQDCKICCRLHHHLRCLLLQSAPFRAQAAHKTYDTHMGFRHTLCPGFNTTFSPGFTCLITPSILNLTSSCKSSPLSAPWYISSSRFPPPRFMMSSVFFQWKCMGVSWLSSAIMIFSQYTLSAFEMFPFLMVNKTSPLLEKSPEPKSVISQPRLFSMISRQIAALPLPVGRPPVGPLRQLKLVLIKKIQ
jgi:hypothetical protein